MRCTSLTVRVGIAGIACLSTTLAARGGSDPPAPKPDSVQAAITRLETQIPQWMARTGVPGVAVAVVFRGQTVYAHGFGVRRVDQGGAVDADTVFQLA